MECARDDDAVEPFFYKLALAAPTELGNLVDSLPRASFADSLCLGLLSVGLSALETSRSSSSSSSNRGDGVMEFWSNGVIEPQHARRDAPYCGRTLHAGGPHVNRLRERGRRREEGRLPRSPLGLTASARRRSSPGFPAQSRGPLKRPSSAPPRSQALGVLWSSVNNSAALMI